MIIPAEHWRRVQALAKKLHADGCTSVPDLWFRLCCYDHDIAYRTHRDADGNPITKAQADWNLRKSMAQASPLAKIKLGFLSPLSWLYFAGVVALGAEAWKKGDRYGRDEGNAATDSREGSAGLPEAPRKVGSQS